MKIIIYTPFYIAMICLMFSCSSTKNNKKIKEPNQKINTEQNNDTKKQYLFDENTEPFYTIDPKLEDIESEIALLKDKVIQYESQISTPNFNTEILKLIKTPNIKHEIELSNGTTIQGTIIYENSNEMIVETQIGQLKIKKNQITKIEDVLPPVAIIEFIGDGIEQIYKDSRTYKGSIKNIGLKRADFVRVIYSIYDQNSDLIAADSSFVSGNVKQYNSGIVSDASVNQNSFADYNVNINIPEDKVVKYFLREIRWEYYE
tara:strand:- start:398 stop:1177 length:780 start_codon:yes stop_codon:yes gene_type:complete